MNKEAAEGEVMYQLHESNPLRGERLKYLRETLTARQRKSLEYVLSTIKVRGNWNWNGEDSMFEDDISLTCDYLAKQLGMRPWEDRDIQEEEE